MVANHDMANVNNCSIARDGSEDIFGDDLKPSVAKVEHISPYVLANVRGITVGGYNQQQHEEKLAKERAVAKIANRYEKVRNQSIILASDESDPEAKMYYDKRLREATARYSLCKAVLPQ